MPVQKPTKPTQRVKNYSFARASVEEELEWMRPEDFEDHDLPRPLILCNGSFDILHAGHMRLLFTARAHAPRGTVVVAMDSDALVKRNKPKADRPKMSWVERATTLGYMPIDYLVEIDNKRDMDLLVRNLKPDLRVQGADYRGKDTRYPSVPKLYVRRGGMSTSEIIRRCQQGA